MGRAKRERQAREERTHDASYVPQESFCHLENAVFTQFYKGSVVPDDDWERFIGTLRLPLPSCIRINTTLPNAEQFRDHFVQQLSILGQEVQPIAFIPNSMAFHLGVSRGELKRNADHRSVKQLMSLMNVEGLITRQEAVSMIPPLLLDVQPGHRVIDMCAAPGSKSTQILERLIIGGPDGLLVANDVNQGRLDVLSHQAARLPFGARSRLIVTKHDATMFPLVTSTEHKFDRVLCDVMCSGDGTLRKSLDLWSRWNPLLGPHLHIQQSRVLLRGMGLCKQGGVVVYSTCSMNPVEDEAVVARCLTEAAGAFELIDVSTTLHGLRYSKGLCEWRLLNADGSVELHGSSDAEAVTTERTRQVGVSESPAVRDEPKVAGSKQRFTFCSSMFPPPPAIAAELHLERCVRVLPHFQNTGGFFIAALRCHRELPHSVSSAAKGKYAEGAIRGLSEEARSALARALDLPSHFPFHHLFTASESGRHPSVRYLSADAASLLPVLNAKVLQAGIKMFESPVRHSWAHMRITSEGASTIALILPEWVFDGSASAVIERCDGGDDSHDLQWPLSDFLDTVCPTFDVRLRCGVARFGCPSLIGNLYLPLDVVPGNKTVHVRASPTQLDLLRYSLGRALGSLSPRRDGSSDDENENHLTQSAP